MTASPEELDARTKGTVRRLRRPRGSPIRSRRERISVFTVTLPIDGIEPCLASKEGERLRPSHETVILIWIRVSESKRDRNHTRPRSRYAGYAMHAKPESLAMVNAALEQTISRCHPLVTRVCRSRLSGLPMADIEDAIQETFLQLVAADYTTIKNVDAWLIAVALRVCSRTLRNRYRRPEVQLADAPITSSADAIELADEQLWLAKVATLLPTSDVKLLHLLYVQDLTYREVASYFHVSNGHARVLAYRARQRARSVADGLQ